MITFENDEQRAARLSAEIAAFCKYHLHARSLTPPQIIIRNALALPHGKRAALYTLHLDTLHSQYRASELAGLIRGAPDAGAFAFPNEYEAANAAQLNADAKACVARLELQFEAQRNSKPWPPKPEAKPPLNLLSSELREIEAAEQRVRALGGQPPARPALTRGQTVPQMKQALATHLAELHRLERESKPAASTVAPTPAPPAPTPAEPRTLSALRDSIAQCEAALRERGEAIPARPKFDSARERYGDFLATLSAHLAELERLQLTSTNPKK